ncbi:MAG: hypothetical protein RL398_1234, partial [Planctomycetota bacterium]
MSLLRSGRPGCLRTAAWALAALSLATELAAQGGAAVAPLFVEVSPATQRGVVEQALQGVLRVGYDAAWFAEHAVPVLAQPLDLPFAVRGDWLDGGDEFAVTFAEAANGPRGAVGSQARRWHAAATVERDGRRLAIVELPFAFVATAKGAAPGATDVRYAFASAFTDDFLRGRQPVDRTEASVSAPAPAWTVEALPAAGRPADFGGAVGEFAVALEVPPSAIVGGESELRLVVTGSGNLTRFAAPALPQWPGWHLAGLREVGRDGARVFAFAAVPLRDGPLEVPPLRLPAYVPSAGAYRELLTAPTTIPVDANPNLGALPPRLAELLARDRAERAAAAAVPAWYWLVVILAGGLTLLGAMRTRGKRQRRAQLAAAAAELVRHADDAPDAVLRLLEHVVALRLGVPSLDDAAWANC